ncbi:MAG: sugar ABC transporter permease [Bacillota bacterium]|nr:sugar ABC transporter permease [Bacillota bacterium]
MNIRKRSLNGGAWYWTFLTPSFVALMIVVLIPFIIGIYYSLTTWDAVNPYSFIGFKNFTNLLHDKLFWNSLLFTAKFALVFVFLINLLGLGLAMLVTRAIPFKNFMRTSFYLPNLIGGLILGFIWNFIFIDVFSTIGDALGISGLKVWLSTTNTGFWGMVIITAWQMAGYVMVIYIAYIESVPVDLIEASQIDGANSWQQFRKITFPLIFPAFTISLFITLSNAFKIFDQNLSLTKGAPGNTTQMITLNIYQTAYSEKQMAYGQAKAVVMFLIIATISILQVYFSKKREVEQ